MPKEIEVQFRVTESEVLAHPILEPLFRGVQRYREDDAYFEDGIRVRLIYDDTGNWYTIEITKKGEDGTPNSAVRTRDEPTLVIHPASRRIWEEYRAFLETCGNKEKFVLQKKVREIRYFTESGNMAKLFLATFARLGDFLEIEGESVTIVMGIACHLE